MMNRFLQTSIGSLVASSLAAGTLALCCTLAWGAKPKNGYLVLPATPIAFSGQTQESDTTDHDLSPPQEGDWRGTSAASQGRLDDPNVEATRDDQAASPTPVPSKRPQREPIVRVAQQLSLSPVQRSAQAEQTDPLYDPNAAFVTMHLTSKTRHPTDASSPPAKDLDSKPLARVFYRGEVDRLARRPRPRSDRRDLLEFKPAVASPLKTSEKSPSSESGVAPDQTQVAEAREGEEMVILSFLPASQLLPPEAAEATGQQEAGVEAPSDASESPEADESLDDGLVQIGETKTDIRPSDGILPENYAAEHFRGELTMQEGASRDWPMYAFWWESPASCHQPLYFEQPNVERYGYHHGLAQSLFSGAHFFGTIPALPYLMAADSPHERIYTLGHYRPGSYVPYHTYYPPLSLKGALAEGAALTGLFFLIP